MPMSCVASGESRAGPCFVSGHVVHNVEPFGDEVGGLIAVIDLSDQRAVIMLVDGDQQSIAMDHVPPLAEKSRRQGREECPLVVVEVEVRARYLRRPIC
jgi:hypothetical protein